MAEVIGLGASLIAFIQLADRVISLAKHYIESIDGCPRDIRVTLAEISSLKAVLENLDFLLKNDAGPESHLLEQLAGDGGPIEECRKSVSELEKMLPSHIKTTQGKRRKVLAAAQQLAWPLREGSAKRLLDDISRYKASMQFALTYDSTRDIKDIKKDLRLVKETLTQAERNEICTWLENTNPSSNHNNACNLREDHTGLWVLRSTEWKDWLAGKLKFLWICGIPGAGKTVLTSFLIEQAQNFSTEQSSIAIPPKPIFCVYYYCYFARNQDEAAPFLQWLVSQLCRQAKLIPSEIDQLFQLKHLPSVSQLLVALEHILAEFSAVLVIIDAVDESQSREDLLKILRDLITDNRFDKVRLLATSREYFDIELSFSDISTRISMANPLVEEDIQRYVHSTLLSNRKFQGWSQSLISETTEALAKGAKGMFRWAVCQMEALQRLRRQEDVRNAIANLPKTLDETYERIFQLLPEEDCQFVRMALIFICGLNELKSVKFAPVSANVLLQATNFHLGCVYDDDNHMEAYWDVIRDRCGCLVSLSTDYFGEERVILAHYTVKEFLYSDRIAKSRISKFALSNWLVQSTCSKMILEVIIEDHETKVFKSHALHFYCSLVVERLLSDDFIYKHAGWKVLKENKDLKDLAAKYEFIEQTVSYQTKSLRIRQARADDLNRRFLLLQNQYKTMH